MGAWLAILAALLVSAILSWVLSLCGPVDRALEARRAHDTPTPTSGGVAFIGAVAVALAMLERLGPVDTATLAAFGVAALFGLLGALDDVFDFGARTKLGLQVLLALGFALVTHPARVALSGTLAFDLPALVAVAGTALWVVVAVNAVNFVDGANGLIAGTMAIVLGGLGLIMEGAPALLWLAGAAACLGFLPWNFPKARLFQGDAGALFLGALFATGAVAANHGSTGHALSLFAAPIALAPLLTDVFLTLVVRARRRARLFEAHNDHLYQRWMAAHGGDHTRLALGFWAIMAASTLLAMATAQGDPAKASLALIGVVVVSVIGWLSINQGLKRSG